MDLLNSTHALADERAAHRCLPNASDQQAPLHGKGGRSGPTGAALSGASRAPCGRSAGSTKGGLERSATAKADPLEIGNAEVTAAEMVQPRPVTPDRPDHS